TAAAGSWRRRHELAGAPWTVRYSQQAPVRRAGQTNAGPVRTPLQYPQPTAPRSAATQTTGRIHSPTIARARNPAVTGAGGGRRASSMTLLSRAGGKRRRGALPGWETNFPGAGRAPATEPPWRPWRSYRALSTL